MGKLAKDNPKKKKMNFKKGRQKNDGGLGGDMAEIALDPRFAHVTSDPKFRHAPKDQRKVKLDPRFQSVFTDSQFYEVSSMDPRGRKGNFSTKEELHKFYDMSSSEDSSSDEVEGETVDREMDKTSSLDQEDEQVHEDDSKIPADILAKLRDMDKDYARGEVFFSDDSSDGDSTTTDEEAEELEEFEWGELDHDAKWDTEEDHVEETSRFAVCNMDWDRLKAADLMILFSSFALQGGSVKKVTIFPSEYGKERMAEEERTGPQELVQMKGSEEAVDLKELERLEKGKLSVDDGTKVVHFEALRKYQRNRLKYYYAVVECDSVETAVRIYKECDRQPYEGAGILMDLRYIPSDMEFDDVPHDVCQGIPKSYEAKTFSTTALVDMRPTLTWDETNPERKKLMTNVMTKALKGEDIDDDTLRNYLASSSEGEDSLDELGESDSDNDDDDESKMAEKFRAVISRFDERKKKKDEDDVDKEDTIDIPMQEQTDDRISEEEEKPSLTPFEQYLEKRKKKRKERIKMKKQKERTEKELSDGSGEEDNNDDDDDQHYEQTFSDDEIPEDLKNDPFFAKKSEPKKKKKKVSSKNNADEKEDNDGLELLTMDAEEDDKKHFNMRDIIKQNSKVGKKKKWKKNVPNTKEKVEMDDFQVNTKDARFSALMTSGEFNIDPSHPSFKRTKAIDKVIQEVQKKRTLENYEDLPVENPSQGKKNDQEFTNLVKKIKNKKKFKNVV
ncbi:ESF1 homolog [Oratosquilla oratoria]|uniref:ESF1 homolog n=1 Tax=Oratosquilla oratoria TaxID=337810 RepID=UPI003F767827